MLQSWFEKKINERKENLLLRKLTVSEGLIDFTSNDYLGLARSEELSRQIVLRMRDLGVHSNGATGSRLLSGNDAYTQTVERKLARIFKAEAALIFNSGYAANLAVLSSLPQRGDTILYDELSHACIKDGARLSLASRFSFRHNDLDDLEQKIRRAKGRVFVVVESIYSMDGDECPLIQLTTLANGYGASLIIDEAHSTGIVGESGNGLSVSIGVHEQFAARVYTFGKAMGIHGAVVVGSQLLIDYLINFSRPFIYTTALPPHSVVAIECAFDFLSKNIALQDALRNKINLFCEQVASVDNRTDSKSPIQTALYPGNENVKRAAQKVQAQNFDVRPILSPTVPVNAERLRICLHTFNTDDDIVALASLLKSMNGLV
ncbi:aminotransferase class I/II-fold pyridoxal phosphate-dependent enzyme [Pseudochryseolinea flava]|uniref:8-amino-7-oxononanoate synthase n=1 Tax=Pseudochryseolinea flava TaxID=2059302 RepID=A0A364XXX2_9BACT|nr:8-amino-7-oxononanoate synthase [Pseudochryseolinea flava]RAV98271.1 8-amino-7-oxononanoate synthase [Pseudochryseolinea flava]